MELQLGKKYKTRGGAIAEVTHTDIDDTFIYCFFGRVILSPTMENKTICSWTSNGKYIINRETPYDIISEID